jgi:hypothetical protein
MNLSRFYRGFVSKSQEKVFCGIHDTADSISHAPLTPRFFFPILIHILFMFSYEMIVHGFQFKENNLLVKTAKPDFSNVKTRYSGKIIFKMALDPKTGA